MVGVYGVAAHEWRHALDARADGHHFWLGFRDHHVDALAVVDIQSVGPSVAGEAKAQAVPIQAVSRSSVLGVGGRPMDDLDTVLFIGGPAGLFDWVAEGRREFLLGVLPAISASRSRTGG